MGQGCLRGDADAQAEPNLGDPPPTQKHHQHTHTVSPPPLPPRPRRAATTCSPELSPCLAPARHTGRRHNPPPRSSAPCPLAPPSTSHPLSPPPLSPQGVDLDNAGEFLKSGANSIGLVAPLFPADAVAAGKWDVIQANAVKVIGNVKAALA